MQEKYDLIGQNYNRTRSADPYLLERLHQLLQARSSGRYLDIGSGTGNYTSALSSRGLNMIGVEPSARMLTEARTRNEAVDWRQGHAEQIPLNDHEVDGVVASLTLHHWTSLEAGFREWRRVLKPEGRVVIFTATPRQMEGYWLNH